MLAPNGRLLVIDLAEHERTDLTGKLAHRWPGFSDTNINRMFTSAGVEWRDPVAIPGTLPIRIWPAVRMADVTTAATRELAL